MSIAINGPNEAPVDESSLSSHTRSISIGRVRCVHVARVKRCIVLSHSLDLHQMVMVSPRVAM